MTFQITDITVIIALVFVFIAVSVISAIIAYKTHIKKIRRKLQENENIQE